MAAPSYTTDLTTINVVDTAGGTTNWSALGGGAAGLNSETDYYIQGDGCLSKNGFTAATKGMIYNAGSQTIGSFDGVFIWARQANRNLLDTQTLGGGQLLIGSGTGAYNQYYVDGNDVEGSDLLSWRSYAVRIGETPSATTGSPTTTRSHFGFQWKILGSGSLKGAPNGIDAMRFGRELICTDGDVTNGYATFEGAANTDATTSNRWGILTPSAGSYLFHGRFVIGSVATSCDFRDSDRVISVLDDGRFVQSTFNEIATRNASTNIEWTNIQINHLGRDARTILSLSGTTATTVDSCRFDGCAYGFIDGSGVYQNTTWKNCWYTDITGGGEATNCTFNESGGQPIIGSQDETNYDNSPTTEGTFSGGSGHAVNDVITLSDTSWITVDAVSTGVVTQFTVTDSQRSDFAQVGTALTQTNTTGSGTGFSLTPGRDNINENFSAAVIWGDNTEPDGLLDGCTFIAGNSYAHAILFENTSIQGGEFTLRNCTFTGYSASNDSDTSTFYFTETVGSITLNLIDCTGNVSYRTEGITVTIVQNPKITKVTVEDADGTLLQNARVFLETSTIGGIGALPYQESVSSLTQTGGTATLTASAAHGLATNDYVVVRGSNDEGYNRQAQITVTGTTTFTYTVPSGTTATSGGTPIFSYVAISGLTNAGGVIQSSKVWPATQSLSGWVRRSTTAPYYAQSVITIADASNGTDLLVALQPDE